MATILVVAPHPDDEILGCGGVMARHAAAGDSVQVLIVTRGVPELFPPAIIEQTRRELREAHALLQVAGVTFLDYPAPKLDTIPGHQLADSIGQVIRTVQPSVLYLPHRGDIHLDHQAVYQAGLVAARPRPGGGVTRILTYETLSETEWASPQADAAFVPTVFCDITAYLEVKLAAMACLVSQVHEPPNSRSLRTIEALARYRGATVGLHAAEAFMLVREVA